MTGKRQNYARTSVRLRPDYRRIGQSISYPGIDPRTWIALARVDVDPDAVVWDEDFGWLVDVTFIGGELDGEGPVVATMDSLAQGSGQGRYEPPRAGGLVLVAVPNGDPNDDVAIIQQIHTEGDVPPSSVNGDTIVERDPSAGEVAAIDTHLAVFPQEDADEEWRARRVATSGAHRIHGETVELGLADADQPFARGNDLADALDSVIGAIGDFANTISTAPPAAPNAALTVASVLAAVPALQAAIVEFQSARSQYLSTRISGD